MAAKSIESIADALKEMIDRDGPFCLADEPYRVYSDLIRSDAADRKTAAALLHFLVSGEMACMDSCDDAEQISEIIRRECSLNKRMADRLALILTSLYSGAHRKEWKGKNREGLKQFLKEEFRCTWKGFSVWDAGNGTVDCHYEAEIVLTPTERISEDKELARMLKQNPFLTKEAIHDLFAKRLQGYLDHKFEYYCTCEDYYQPAVEDFDSNLEYDLPEWCKDNGFEYVLCDGGGEDDGYEPKYRSRR